MRPTFRYLAAAAAIVSLAACSESATSPAASASRIAPPSDPAFDFSGGGSRSFGDQSSNFTVTSRGGSFTVNGLFTVNFPANSVCNPDRSSYGPTEWDKDCSTLRADESVRVQARLRLTSTGVAVDFSPALRFAPNTQVTLSTDIFASVLASNRSYFSANHQALNLLAVNYSASLGNSGVADYTADPTVMTHVNLATGTIWRRVKHFSGYAMAGGESCEPAPDIPDCVWVDGAQQ
jgi:hypothetical protein